MQGRREEVERVMYSVSSSKVDHASYNMRVLIFRKVDHASYKLIASYICITRIACVGCVFNWLFK